MKEKNYTGLVPPNVAGEDITAESSVNFISVAEARQFYDIAKRRLLDVNNWGKITGALSADFQLTDDAGNKVIRPVQKGDHFRIDITGPGSSAGEGFDWAEVEDIREVDDDTVSSLAILVKPARNPETANKEIAHFFSVHSSSTFVITRENTKVTASVYDRNIEANEETKEPVDKVRNSIVGLAAKHGFSKLQWNALVNAFVETGRSDRTKQHRD